MLHASFNFFNVFILTFHLMHSHHDELFSDSHSVSVQSLSDEHIKFNQQNCFIFIKHFKQKHFCVEIDCYSVNSKYNRHVKNSVFLASDFFFHCQFWQNVSNWFVIYFYLFVDLKIIWKCVNVLYFVFFHQNFQNIFVFQFFICYENIKTFMLTYDIFL